MKGNKKFDIDLKYGQIREDKVKDMFSNAQIEVKSERSWWRKTGNIAMDKYKDKLTKDVGDNKASKCVLIPIKEIFTEEFYSYV
jgi:hypothetical protein